MRHQQVDANKFVQEEGLPLHELAGIILPSIPNAAIDSCRGGFYQGCRTKLRCVLTADGLSPFGMINDHAGVQRRKNPPMCEDIVEFGIEGSICPHLLISVCFAFSH